MISSPCIGLCRIDDASDLCLGCARTREEIALWREASPDGRTRIWAELPARREKLGLTLHRLDWDARTIGDFIVSTLRPGAVWSSGIDGALAEFSVGEDETINVQADDSFVRAVTARGGIAFRLGEQVRAFCIGATPADGIVVLAVHRSRTAPFEGPGLARLGPDRDALREQDRNAPLYDFGLGFRTAAFGLRTGSPQLATRLDAAVGRDWQAFLPEIGDDLRGAAPARVIRNAIGRIEIFTAIPPDGGAAPEGPHTHFLPARLAGAIDAPTGIALPEGFVAGAIHYSPGRAGRQNRPPPARPASQQQKHVAALDDSTSTPG
jgi:predicted Fe-S protein YdhL (DUF1289 family)